MAREDSTSDFYSATATPNADDVSLCSLRFLLLLRACWWTWTRADVKIEDILSVNHGLKKDVIEEGQTILLPSSKLSERDREILDGVKGKGKYRAYPVRKGETIEDIISKRGIKIAEVEALNEGVDLASLKAYQVIKLPKNKYTEREKEMLVGCARVPSAFFSGKSGLGFGKIAMVVLIAGVAGVAAWKSRED